MLGGAALWCLLFLNEAQPLRAVTVAADDPENAINEERKFADNGGVNHFTRASYIELRNRRGIPAHFFFCRSAPLPPGPPEQRRRSVQEPQDDVGGVLALQESSPFPIGTEPIQFKIKIWPNRDTAAHSGRQPQDIRPSQLHIYLLPRLDHYSIACILIMDIPGVRTKGVFLSERPIAMSSSPTGFRQ